MTESNETTNELIQKYLDDAASTTELAALEARLVQDLQAAESLAWATRMEAGLTRIFRTEEKSTAVLSQLRAAEPQDREARSRSLRYSRKAMWQAAAGILLTVGTFSLLYRYLRPDPQPTASPGNQVVAGDVLIDGMPGQWMHDGSSLQVLGAGPAVVRLSDGSRVEFEPGATALIHGRDAGLRQWVELNEGSGTFQVEKADGEFQVATQIGSVTALGTEFSVAILPASLAGDMLTKIRSTMLIVAVLSGVVQVEFGDQTYALAAGERRVFTQEQDLPGLATADNDKAAPPATVRRTVTTSPPGTRRGDAANIVRGPISFVDRTKVVLGGRLGSTEFPLRADARLTIDGKPAALEQFNGGMVVSVERQDGQGPVIGMHAAGSTIGASLLSIDEEKQTMTVLTVGGDPGSKRTYALAGDVSITLNGQAAKLSDLQPGTAVSLKLSVDFKTVIAVTRARRRSS